MEAMWVKGMNGASLSGKAEFLARKPVTVRGPSVAPSDAKIWITSVSTIVVLTKFFWEFRTGQSF